MFSNFLLELGRASRKLPVGQDVVAALLQLAAYAVALGRNVGGGLGQIDFLFERQRVGVWLRLFDAARVASRRAAERLERLHDVEREVFEPVPVALVFVGRVVGPELARASAL